jgi:hypothetical protein
MIPVLAVQSLPLFQRSIYPDPALRVSLHLACPQRIIGAGLWCNMLRFATSAYSERICVETNQYLNLINDLQNRSEELRGYL